MCCLNFCHNLFLYYIIANNFNDVILNPRWLVPGVSHGWLFQVILHSIVMCCNQLQCSNEISRRVTSLCISTQTTDAHKTERLLLRNTQCGGSGWCALVSLSQLHRQRWLIKWTWWSRGLVSVCMNHLNHPSYRPAVSGVYNIQYKTKRKRKKNVWWCLH